MPEGDFYQVFDNENLKENLKNYFQKISGLKNFENSWQKQVCTGIPPVEFQGKRKLKEGNFYSRYCDFLMTVFDKRITGGALFEFAAATALKAYFGNKVEFVAQPREIGKKSTNIFPDWKLEANGSKIFIECKREKDKDLDFLEKYEEQNFTPIFGVVFAYHPNKKEWDRRENEFRKSKIFVNHICKVGQGVLYKTRESGAKNGEAYRMKDSKIGFGNINRHRNDYIEALIEAVEETLKLKK